MIFCHFNIELARQFLEKGLKGNGIVPLTYQCPAFRKKGRRIKPELSTDEIQLAYCGKKYFFKFLEYLNAISNPIFNIFHIFCYLSRDTHQDHNFWSVKGQQGQSKIRKANPKSERSVQGQKSQSKVSKVLIRSRSERLDEVSPRSSQSKVSKVNPRSGNAS